jgi:exodeoxyribonuclease V alpha subunit
VPASRTRLSEANSKRHCGLPRADLLPLAIKLLAIRAEVIEQAIDQELQEGVVIADDIDGKPCVFLASPHDAECGIAGQVRRLQSGTVPWPRIDADKAIPSVQRHLGVGLAQSQKGALRLALAPKMLV